LVLLQFMSEMPVKVFRKRIDGGTTEVTDESLSLKGMLFEIYFVRLIGTPNQNSKNGAGLRIGTDVSSS